MKIHNLTSALIIALLITTYARASQTTIQENLIDSLRSQAPDEIVARITANQLTVGEHNDALLALQYNLIESHLDSTLLERVVHFIPPALYSFINLGLNSMGETSTMYARTLQPQPLLDHTIGTLYRVTSLTAIYYVILKFQALSNLTVQFKDAIERLAHTSPQKKETKHCVLPQNPLSPEFIESLAHCAQQTELSPEQMNYLRAYIQFKQNQLLLPGTSISSAATNGSAFTLLLILSLAQRTKAFFNLSLEPGMLMGFYTLPMKAVEKASAIASLYFLIQMIKAGFGYIDPAHVELAARLEEIKKMLN